MKSLLILFLAALAAMALESTVTRLSGPELKTAQKLYLGKCAKCHELYNPSSYNDRDWQRWMQKMKKKAHLNDEQFELLSRYIDNLRSAQPPHGLEE